MKARLLAFVFALTAIVAVPKSEAAWHIVNVPAGGDLQAALDNAKPGDSIRLAAGATYVGHFVLRAKGATTALPIIIRSVKDLPARRVSPADAKLMPKIMSPDAAAAISTEPGVAVSGYVLKYLEVVANETQSDLIMFGRNDKTQTALSQVPFDFEVSHCYIHGTSTSNAKRGIALNAKHVSIHDSYLSDFHVVAQDSQAIGGYNGIGYYTIENNYLEAAGEVVMFGGDDPKILGLPSQHDIIFRYNRVTRPMAWKGGSWQIKNLFELKSGEHVLVEGNIFENHWPQAQKGVAIVVTPRNQYGSAPQTVVGDVQFRHNVIRNVSAAFNIMGYDNNFPSQQTHDIEISNNTVFVDSKVLGGGDGRFIDLDVGTIEGAKNVHVFNNTVNSDGSSVVYASGDKPFYGFEYNDNLSLHNAYGIMGKGIGNGTLAYYFPGAQFMSNVLAGGNPKNYPTGNMFPTVADFLTNFVDFKAGDFTLTAGSAYHGLGADVATVLAMTAGR